MPRSARHESINRIHRCADYNNRNPDNRIVCARRAIHHLMVLDIPQMTFSSALALFSGMRPEQRKAVVHLFEGIAAGFDDVEEAFIQSVNDEFLAIQTEMLLLAKHPAPEAMQ
jgi:hypothetical protein